MLRDKDELENELGALLVHDDAADENHEHHNRKH